MYNMPDDDGMNDDADFGTPSSQRYYVPRLGNYRDPNAKMHPAAIFGWFFGIAAAFVIIFGGGTLLSHLNTDHVRWENIQLTHVDDQANGSGNGHTYLIYTSNQGEFKDTDNWWMSKTDSSDVFNNLLNAGQGAVLRCRIQGERVRFTSGYPNIINCPILIRKGNPNAGGFAF